MARQEYNTLPIYTLKLVREGKVRYPVSRCGHQEAAVSILHTYLWEKECEHLVVLLLDGQHNFLGMTLAAKGGIHGLHVGVRDVFKVALRHRAASIILSHNHPSGDVSPSSEDDTFTQCAVQAGKLLGCPVLDHIILSSGIHPKHYSYQYHGRLHMPALATERER